MHDVELIEELRQLRERLDRIELRLGLQVPNNTHDFRPTHCILHTGGACECCHYHGTGCPKHKGG
jgi:hypothetical protein